MLSTFEMGGLDVEVNFPSEHLLHAAVVNVPLPVHSCGCFMKQKHPSLCGRMSAADERELGSK
jgi:hypothetical protein